MFQWQWKLNGRWMECSEENNQLLTERFETPSMEPVFLTNIYGELWGCPEQNQMTFRIHDEEAETVSSVRRCKCAGDSTIYVVYNGSYRLALPPSACRQLFEERAEAARPRHARTEVCVGEEIFVAKDQLIFRQVGDKLLQVRWKPTNLSEDQYMSGASARYEWEFKGPFRNERMQQAVTEVCNNLTARKRRTLSRLYAMYNPDDNDATEYGPYQFPDFLSASDQDELACLVGDQFHAIPEQDWQPFNGSTNFKIEKQRQDGQSVTRLNIRGRDYLLLFDSGGGASGQPPVIIRPGRYNKILTSIEDQFRATALRELFDALISHDIHPVSFLSSTRPEDLLGELSNREFVLQLFHKVTHASQYIATRIQRFMPALLDKYKECEVRLSSHEHLSPKKLAATVAATIETGLQIPRSYRLYCPTFRELVRFIQQTQSWTLDTGPTGHCHICLESGSVVLNHCGSASACLKCWVDTLVETNMNCPFCRQEVNNGQLTLSSGTANILPTSLPSRRRFQSVDDVLQVIHLDQQYSDITLKSVNTMRKWFTILVRQHVVDISQLPSDGQVEKNLTTALTEFQVL